MKILIVEDEAPLAKGLKFNFEQEGYEAVIAGDGPTALALLEQENHGFDLVTLDLMLPCMSGYQTCQRIREFNPQIPILVLSARSLSEDRAQAFDCGSDQYLTKPFALPELLSRVRSLLERRQALAQANSGTSRRAGDMYQFGDVRVEFSKYEVTVGEKTHNLTTMELQLLRYFIEHEGTVLSRTQILEDVWDESFDITTRSIDNFVMRLRKMIEANPAEPRHILSVRGTGYRFLAEPKES
jgi:two-component system OmpR family response regulator